ncbi:MAG TPA: hypothetical protein ENL12_01380 [Dehalococcoidia bacterium]|nr:hypothetical protein [Dehalococcoidia bacterium]
MISPQADLDRDDYSEVMPAFSAIVPMSFTYNLGVGPLLRLVLHPLRKVFAGRVHIIPPRCSDSCSLYVSSSTRSIRIEHEL